MWCLVSTPDPWMTNTRTSLSRALRHSHPGYRPLVLLTRQYEDEDDCRELVEPYWQRKTKEKPVTVPLRPPQIPHGLTWDRTGTSAVRGRRLTAWAMTRRRHVIVTWATYSGVVCISQRAQWLCTFRYTDELVDIWWCIKQTSLSLWGTYGTGTMCGLLSVVHIVTTVLYNCRSSKDILTHNRWYI